MTMQAYVPLAADGIPPELRDRPQWVAWCYEDRGGKPTKVPINVRSGLRASPTDPATWAAFAAARTYAEAHGLPGVGYVLDAGDPYAVVDLDKCRDPDRGTIDPWALDIVRRLNSYTEISPSGTGLHIFVRGSIPPTGNRNGSIEMYDSRRYFTITGQHFRSASGPSAVIEERQGELAELHASIFPMREAASRANNNLRERSTQAGDSRYPHDELVLTRARSAENGAKFRALYDDGDTSGHGDDDSAADLALCSHLAFYTGPDSQEQIDRLFRRSGLMRQKWDRQDYRERTIAKALQREEFWQPPAPPPPIRRNTEPKQDNSNAANQENQSNRANRANHGNRIITLTSLSDLLNEPEEETAWVVEGLLPSGGLSLLVAKPKVGKTTLARNIALAVARGSPILDRTTAQGPVIYLALEEKRARVIDHFRQMGALDEPIYTHVGSAPDKALDILRELIAQYEPVLAIVDPLLKFIRLRDGNDYAEVSREMEPLIDLARESGCHLLCVHHLGKGEREGGDDVLGSTALFAAVDTLLKMRKSDGDRVVGSVQRYGDDLPATILRLDDETGAIDTCGTIEEARKGRMRKTILAALEEDWVDEKEIRRRVGSDESLAAKVLREMVAEGYIRRTGDGRKGAPYLYAAPLLRQEEGSTPRFYASRHRPE